MGKEINLLQKYPKSKRDTKFRNLNKTKKDQEIAKLFERDFFDGERKHGYGGYYYNSKYWTEVAKDMIDYYKLNENSSILDVGCAKGFLLYEFKKIIPNINVQGIDISKYAIDNAKEEVKKYLSLGNAKKLPFKDNSFDLTISLVTLHNLNETDCASAIKEISRVSKKNSFITLDAYSSEEEKQYMDEWNLTALTVMHVDEWKKFFLKNNYKGDYFWFNPLN